MFERLRKAFSSAAKNIGQKEISEKDLDDILLELQLSLGECDVAQEVAVNLTEKLRKNLLGVKLEKGQKAQEVVTSKLQSALAEMFARAGKLDLVAKIKSKKESKEGPFVIVFLGINGTGKTTTVAKVANLLRKSGISVVLAAGDTHRSGAIEQLTTHAERLSLKIVAQRYGADPSAVGRDALEYAKKHYVDAVLIDTAGRMQTAKNLMDEMSKIVRVVKPDIKIFIGDSLAGNDTINQAKEFFQYTKFDGAILTKVDADSKGGAAISVVHITSKPVIFVGVGQGYNDIIAFDPDKFIESIFGNSAEVSVESLMLEPQRGTIETVQPEGIQVQEKNGVEEKSTLIENDIGLAKVAETAPRIDYIPETEAASPSRAEDIVTEVLNESKEEQMITTQTKQNETRRSTLIPEQEKQPKQLMQQEIIPIHPAERVESKEKKKGLFGGFFGKKSKEEKERKKEVLESKEDEKKKRIKLEEQKEKKMDEEQEVTLLEEKNERTVDAVKKPKGLKEDQKKEENEIIYLTDEDIEDLLK